MSCFSCSGDAPPGTGVPVGGTTGQVLAKSSNADYDDSWVTLAASAYTDTTVATNLTSGTLPNARLPLPTSTLLGGVKSFAAVAGKFLTSIGTDGIPVSAFVSVAGASDVAVSTWTPLLQTDANSTTLWTYSTHVGGYLKLSTLVFLWWDIVCTAHDVSSGGPMALKLTGIPGLLTSANDNNGITIAGFTTLTNINYNTVNPGTSNACVLSGPFRPLVTKNSQKISFIYDLQDLTGLVAVRDCALKADDTTNTFTLSGGVLYRAAA